MKRIACLLISALVLGGSAAYAQGGLDAYKLSHKELNGTARYLGMSGAFGALGGDISSMSTNPAGLGIYRSSEVVTTLSLSSIKAKTDWSGSKADENKTKFNFDNIAYVGYFPTGNDDGIVGWNVGLSYNRVKDFNRSYRMGRAGTSDDYSLADYIADRTTGIPEKDLQLVKDGYDPYFDSNPYISWMSILGYEAGLIEPYAQGGDQYHTAFGRAENGKWLPYSPKTMDLWVSEKGSIGQYNFSFATNISNRVFLGATVAVTDMDYSMTSEYSEYYAGEDHLFWDNALSTTGTGYAFNIGAIYRPADFLRLGVAYNSPTWYKMTDYYYATAETYIGAYNDPERGNHTPDNQAADYRLRTSDRWIFSAAGIIGQSFLISVDYELDNYKNMHLSDRNGNEGGFRRVNKDVKRDFGSSGTLKVGAEYKVTPQFSIRAGGLWRNSPMKSHMKNGTPPMGDEGFYSLDAVAPFGTVPNYTIDKGVSSYSVGLGYRFTPSFYVDLACVLRQHKEDAYAFSNTFQSGLTQPPTEDDIVIKSIPATLKTNTTQVALTLGYKF